MTISQLFEGLSYRFVRAPQKTGVATLVDDSRKVSPDSLFFAVPGHLKDGHDFLKVACAAKPVAVVVERPEAVPVDFEGGVIQVASVAEARSWAADRFFASPSAQLRLLGVTGTNGKTTLTYLLEHLLAHVGRRCGVIGTIDHHLGSKRWDTGLTTPGPIELQQRLREFVDAGATDCSIEISSHALDQARIRGLELDGALFTNLTRDHLDYHPNMESYFQAKKSLFAHFLAVSKKKTKVAVINVEGEYGRRLHRDLPGAVGFGEGLGDYSFEILSEDFEGSRFQLTHRESQWTGFLGVPCRHNVSNSMGALALLHQFGYPMESLLEALKSYRGTPGRLQRVPNPQGKHIFVDYAHTDDALWSVLSSLDQIRRKMDLRPRIITVFGCGGDRDRGKRPLMGKAALEFSDLVVVTSDNPRTEDPQRILQDILKGIPPREMAKRVFVEVDRRKGIGIGVQRAKPGDLVLIAGKGHETYQILGQQKIPFSDIEVAAAEADKDQNI